MNDSNILKYSEDLGIGAAPQPSATIQFYSSGTVEVMRLSRDGVWVNPDIKPDEAAQAVLNALDYNIKLLVERAVQDEREECAKVVEAEQARVLGKQEGDSWEPVNINIRMTAVLLPDIAAAIRSKT